MTAYDPAEDDPSDPYEDDDQEEMEDAPEWQEGECCNCAGYVPGPDEFAPACACAMGQGAPPEECRCGPDRMS